MKCRSSDSTECTLDNVFLTDGESGNFVTDLSLPSSVVEDVSDFKQSLYSTLYKHGALVDPLDFDDISKDLFDKNNNTVARNL